MKVIRRTLLIGIILALGAGAVVYYLYTTPALRSGPRTIYVRTGWNYDSLLNKFNKIGVRYPAIFERLSKEMNLTTHIHPGKYKITGAETHIELIRKFRGAEQETVTVRLDGEMSEQQVLSSIFTTLEFDSSALYEAYKESVLIHELGLNDETKLCLFVPDSYFFHWSDSPQRVISRFVKEYQEFWDHEKYVKAFDIGLKPVEVSILAAIVDGEVIFPSELERVAGVYLNRLEKKWPLQADPTIKYIMKEKGRKRVLKADLKIDHPYNTYRNRGLPPGPIMLPSKLAILAVLNREMHNYMFFVAKDDFSGYHDFSRTKGEHDAKARRYRRALDRAGIKR